LREMPVQYPLHVAVAPEKLPARVTVLLVMVELGLTPVWFVKLKALGILFKVVTNHVVEVLPPTVTEAFTLVL